ncbi:MAG: DNA methyltransferase [Prevotellaceae bacterium]|nr:DNA methyltransferase [Prevotellaceae bacterium]
MIKDIIGRNAEAAAGQKEIKVLKEYFPQCFNADGEFDIEAFKAALPEGTTLTDETSGFNWLGKNYARMLTNMDTTTLIRPDEEHNAKPENRDSKNIYISGDNLDALQHLVKSYGGKVKVIYIDPPYNTGSDGFVYNDRFNFTADELAKRLDVSHERAERILSMTRRGSASHAAWLTFMLPRLSFARDLLTDDGVIFISIDENEESNLRLLCNEVFGEENLAGEIVWKNSSKNDEDYISMQHEYILCYVKDKEHNKGSWIEAKIGTDEIFSAFDKFKSKHGNNWKAIHEEALKWYKQFPPSNPIYDSKHYNWMDENGVYFASDISGPNPGQYVYEVIHPITGKPCKMPASGWRFEETEMKKRIDSNLIHFQEDETKIPNNKTYLKDTLNQSLTSIIFRDGRVASKKLTSLMGSNCFSNPKDPDIISKLLSAVGISNKDIVVDFFSGSGTTAESVLSLSLLDKSVHYILVQIQEDLDISLKRATGKGKTIIKNAIHLCDTLGVSHTVDQIGMERIKRAAKKIKEANPLFAGDLGFKHFVLEEPKENVLLQMEKFDPITTISSLTVEDFGLEAVLRTWLVADGYGFTEDAEEVTLGRYKAYWKDNHLYMINPDKDFDANSIAALMDKYNGEPFSPQNIVIFGYSFSFTHCEELQKNLRTLKEGNKTLTVNIDVRY